MSTVIRPEISERNKWYIPKHRYYELKHFCLQYPDWQEENNRLEDYLVQSRIPHVAGKNLDDPTAKIAIKRGELDRKMREVKDAAMRADPQLWTYILDAVTQGHSFVYLRYTLDMPAEKKMYYDRYRKFFWILSHSH